MLKEPLEQAQDGLTCQTGPEVVLLGSMSEYVTMIDGLN